jgi:hypothetical protein
MHPSIEEPFNWGTLKYRDNFTMVNDRILPRFPPSEKFSVVLHHPFSKNQLLWYKFRTFETKSTCAFPPEGRGWCNVQLLPKLRYWGLGSGIIWQACQSKRSVLNKQHPAPAHFDVWRNSDKSPDARFNIFSSGSIEKCNISLLRFWNCD